MPCGEIWNHRINLMDYGKERTLMESFLICVTECVVAYLLMTSNWVWSSTWGVLLVPLTHWDDLPWLQAKKLTSLFLHQTRRFEYKLARILTCVAQIWPDCSDLLVHLWVSETITAISWFCWSHRANPAHNNDSVCVCTCSIIEDEETTVESITLLKDRLR